MIRDEIISLPIAFFYVFLAIAITGLTNMLSIIPPAVDASAEVSNAILNTVEQYFGALIPTGLGFLTMVCFIIVAFILMMHTNERISQGLLSAAKILMFYVGTTLILFLFLEQTALKELFVKGQESGILLITLLVIIVCALGIILFANFSMSTSETRNKIDRDLL